jgi:BASS family bile acid:Na+ symporter
MQGDIVSGVLLPLILAFIMFSLGLGLTVDDFRRIFTQPRALLVGVVCHFVLLPLACFLLLSAWGMTGVFAVGFMMLAACPTGSTSNLLTYLARGDVALALSFTAVASVATIFTLPLVVTWALGHYLGAARAVDVPVGLMMGQVAMVLGLPVSAGMWARHRWGAWARRLRAARHPHCHGAVRAHRGAGRGQELGLAARQLQPPWRRLRCC